MPRLIKRRRIRSDRLARDALRAAAQIQLLRGGVELDERERALAAPQHPVECVVESQQAAIVGRRVLARDRRVEQIGDVLEEVLDLREHPHRSFLFRRERKDRPAVLPAHVTIQLAQDSPRDAAAVIAEIPPEDDELLLVGATQPIVAEQAGVDDAVLIGPQAGQVHVIAKDALVDAVAERNVARPALVGFLAGDEDIRELGSGEDGLQRLEQRVERAAVVGRRRGKPLQLVELVEHENHLDLGNRSGGLCPPPAPEPPHRRRLAQRTRQPIREIEQIRLGGLLVVRQVLQYVLVRPGTLRSRGDLAEEFETEQRRLVKASRHLPSPLFGGHAARGDFETGSHERRVQVVFERRIHQIDQLQRIEPQVQLPDQQMHQLRGADWLGEVDPDVNEPKGTDDLLVPRAVRLDVGERRLDEGRLANTPEPCHQQRATVRERETVGERASGGLAADCTGDRAHADGRVEVAERPRQLHPMIVRHERLFKHSRIGSSTTIPSGRAGPLDVKMLFDFIEEMHDRGEPFEQAICDAGIERLRPVLGESVSVSLFLSRIIAAGVAG